MESICCPVPRPLLLELQLHVGSHRLVDFEEPVVIAREADGSIASPSQQMSL